MTFMAARFSRIKWKGWNVIDFPETPTLNYISV